MPVKIRLMRIGAKKRPFYRVVAVDERNKRTGAYLELLGTYNPLTTPHEVILKKDRIEHWLSQGAVPSVGYLRVIGDAPKRAPKKPKKEQKPIEEAAPAATSTPEAEQAEVVAPAESEASSETPIEASVPDEPTNTEQPAAEAEPTVAEEETPAETVSEPVETEAPAEETK